MSIEKNPGDAFGVGLSFSHIGEAQKIWVGVGLSLSAIVVKNLPFLYTSKEVDIAADSSDTDYDVTVEGAIPADLPLSITSIDVMHFLSTTEPVAGIISSDQFLIGWGDRIYYITGRVDDGDGAAVGGGINISEIMNMMVTVMMVKMMGGIIT